MRTITKDIRITVGVSLQKAPDRVYDRTVTNVAYTLLAATITER